MLHYIRSTSLAGFAAVLLSGCASPPQGTTPYQPTADMAAVLTAQADLGAKPIEDLTPAQARKNPSIADAVTRVEQQRGMSTAPMPARVEDIKVQGVPGCFRPGCTGPPRRRPARCRSSCTSMVAAG